MYGKMEKNKGETNMEYRRFGDTIAVRIDRGEEILEQVREVAQREQIVFAGVQALGATDDFTVGVFLPSEKRYVPNHFSGAYEIVSLTGTIGVKDGAPYLHLHMSAGDADGQVVGGHLNAARVSVTCEMLIRVIDGAVGRRMDDAIGINLWNFD